jgi:hypothetical protein
MTDEKQVEDALKNMDIRLSEEFQEHSFEHTLQGINEARKQVKRNRRFRHIIGATASVTLLAAAIILTVQLIHSDPDTPYDPRHADQQEPTESPADPDVPPAEYEDDAPQAEENGTPDVNDPEAEEPGAEEDSADVERESTREIILQKEGMEEEPQTFNLLNDGYLPFTTYIPGDWTAEGYDQNEYGMYGVRIQPEQYQFARMDILFFDDGMSVDDAVAAFEEIVESDFPEAEPGNEEETWEPWQERVYKVAGRDDFEVGTIILGYDSGHYFYIHEQFVLEALDGWAPIKATIYAEWQWKESGETLGQIE